MNTKIVARARNIDQSINFRKVMKVLNIYRTYFPDKPGGLQEAIRQTCLATNQHGVENTVYTLSPTPEPRTLIRSEAKVVRSRSWIAPASCDLGGKSALSSFSSLAAQADLLHYFFPWPFADFLHLCSNQDKPSIMTYASDIVRQRVLASAYAPLMWKTLRDMDIIVASNPAYVASSPILSDKSIRDKVRIIPLGIDEDSYPLVGDEGIFERISVDIDSPYFLFIGVLRYYKGLHDLVRAAKDVNAKIVIAGTGPENAKLKEIVDNLKLNNVIFAGQITDTEKVSLLRHCRAFILPSHLRSEAYGVVLVEAAMMSKPMISCEIGTGTSFVNLHEETGIVVKPQEPTELATAMQTLLQEDNLATQMGQAARKRYELLFSGKALGEAYFNLYKELM